MSAEDKSTATTRTRPAARTGGFTLVELPAVSKREAAGFTLVELLVVIAIIGLLVAVIFPSVSAIQSYARATICRSNLHDIGVALAARRKAALAPSGAATTATHIYPQWYEWPKVLVEPEQSPDAEIFICPEEDAFASQGLPWNYMEYSPAEDVWMSLSEERTDWFISRGGVDEKGAYREYCVQDDWGDVDRLDWNDWIDTDGVFRVYASGEIWIIDDVSDLPGFEGAHPTETSSCGNRNVVTHGGEPAFGSDGQINTHRGQTFDLPGQYGDALTNYGINVRAYEASFAGDTIVLVDYREQRVEPDDEAETHRKLTEVAADRHRGRVNALVADGGVRAVTAMEISPMIHWEVWRP